MVVSPPVFIPVAIDVRMMIAVSGNETSKFVKALIQRQKRRLESQVPLTKTAGDIALRLKQLGQRNGSLRQSGISIFFAR